VGAGCKVWCGREPDHLAGPDLEDLLRVQSLSASVQCSVFSVQWSALSFHCSLFMVQSLSVSV